MTRGGILLYNAAPRRISAKKREANADAESRAASLKMTVWGGGLILYIYKIY